MSANTDKLASLVAKQEENTRACQAANHAKAKADAAHTANAQEIKDTLAAIATDQAQLVEDAKQVVAAAPPPSEPSLVPKLDAQ